MPSRPVSCNCACVISYASILIPFRHDKPRQDCTRRTTLYRSVAVKHIRTLPVIMLSPRLSHPQNLPLLHTKCRKNGSPGDFFASWRPSPSEREARTPPPLAPRRPTENPPAIHSSVVCLARSPLRPRPPKNQAAHRPHRSEVPRRPRAPTRWCRAPPCQQAKGRFAGAVLFSLICPSQKFLSVGRLLAFLVSMLLVLKRLRD